MDVSCCSPSAPVFVLVIGRPATGVAGARLTMRDNASRGLSAAFTMKAINGEDMSKQ